MIKENILENFNEVVDIENFLLLTDSYKLNHWNQYPELMEAVYSYYESRNGAQFPETVMFGLQYILKKHFVGKVVTRDRIEQAAILAKFHFGDEGLFNREGWEYILEKYDGHIPLRIRAVPEGIVVPINQAMAVFENIDDKCGWLTNHCETLLMHLWFSSVVATLSRHVKKACKHHLDETSDLPDDIKSIVLKYMLHDFGFRGTECAESAGFGGMGHLVNFYGTDTVAAMLYACKYYNADITNLAHSVPATEHSVMTARGAEGEAAVLDQLLANYKRGILSVVSDSYNIVNFIDKYVRERKNEILARIPNEIGVCKFVVRPDSLRYPDDTPEEQMVWILDTLWDIFGGTINTKGKKVLNPKVGALWGDGIDANGIEKILTAANEAGYSVECLVFGMGGGLLQKVNRDTQRTAIKCSAQKIAGKWVTIQKNPMDVSKKSKGGRLALIQDGAGSYKTVTEDGTNNNGLVNLLEVVYENGRLLREHTFQEIRERAKL